MGTRRGLPPALLRRSARASSCWWPRFSGAGPATAKGTRDATSSARNAEKVFMTTTMHGGVGGWKIGGGSREV